MSSFPHHSCLDACFADAAGRVAILSNGFLWIVYITCVWRLPQSVGLQHGDDTAHTGGKLECNQNYLSVHTYPRGLSFVHEKNG